MIVLALGDKGSGKSRLLRSLAAARLARFPTCSILVHDPLEQYGQGAVFSTCAEVRAHVAAKGSLPRLTVVRADSPDEVCRLAWDLQSITLVIDELDLLCSSKRWRSDAARSIAHYGRHRGVDLFGAFRFTRNVNEDLPALADFVFLMRHSTGALFDLRTLSQRFGDYYASTATRLQDHETLVWANGR